MTRPYERESAVFSRTRAAQRGVRGGADRVEALPAESSDTALLSRIGADDASALDLLLERYWAAVFRYALRRTGSSDAAADVAQDVFCRIWEKRATWRASGSVRGLLFRLARNTAVSEHRRRFARDRATRGFADLYLAHAVTPPNADAADLRTALESAIAALPTRRREVFQLRMIEDLSYDEIAQVMGTSKQTVANQLSHALATLRRTLAHLLD